MINKALLLHPKDNVGVALRDLTSGEQLTLAGQTLQLTENITAKHKFALQAILPGEEIRMYGEVVGAATREIGCGAALSVTNIRHKASPYHLSSATYVWDAPEPLQHTFQGYLRADGQVGTANYWLVFPLVFCENQNIQLLQEAFEIALGYKKTNPYVDMIRSEIHSVNSSKNTESSGSLMGKEEYFENIDGIRFITHQMGCGGTREDSQTLCRLLAGYIHNPNVAGATVLSLGCQNAEFTLLETRLNEIQKLGKKQVILCDQQQLGTTEQLLQFAIKETVKGLKEANRIKRSPQPISKLVVGLECGGSDGFSGISANPTLGRVSDLLVASGGSAILSEFPELCGAEQNLINRCQSTELAEKFIHLMESYHKSAQAVGSGFDMNPSPGNIKDGLLTDAIKSLGAAKKGGSAPIVDVLDYTEYLTRPGLNLLCTPGNDVESTTGLAGAGANLILFTTGLGTPTGNPICPVLKVSSNHRIAERMPDIIDFDAGGIISGEKTVDHTADELLELIIRCASGDYQAKADRNRNFDFIPWKRGVSL
ncbi:UxaA family hydrolase [Algoriphagus namhaensis]